MAKNAPFTGPEVLYRVQRRADGSRLYYLPSRPFDEKFRLALAAGEIFDIHDDTRPDQPLLVMYALLARLALASDCRQTRRLVRDMLESHKSRQRAGTNPPNRVDHTCDAVLALLEQADLLPHFLDP